MEWLGTRTALWTACAVNMLNGLAAWRLSRSRIRCLTTLDADLVSGVERRKGTSSDAINCTPAAEQAREPGVGPECTTQSAAVVGYAFFLMELVWYRMLGPILGGTTFTLGLILAVALGGIGIGGQFIRGSSVSDDQICDGWR